MYMRFLKAKSGIDPQCSCPLCAGPNPGGFGGCAAGAAAQAADCGWLLSASSRAPTWPCSCPGEGPRLPYTILHLLRYLGHCMSGKYCQRTSDPAQHALHLQECSFAAPNSAPAVEASQLRHTAAPFVPGRQYGAADRGQSHAPYSGPYPGSVPGKTGGSSSNGNADPGGGVVRGRGLTIRLPQRTSNMHAPGETWFLHPAGGMQRQSDLVLQRSSARSLVCRCSILIGPAPIALLEARGLSARLSCRRLPAKLFCSSRLAVVQPAEWWHNNPCKLVPRLWRIRDAWRCSGCAKSIPAPVCGATSMCMSGHAQSHPTPSAALVQATAMDLRAKPTSG